MNIEKFVENMDYIETTRNKLGEKMSHKDIFTFEELESMLYGLSGALYQLYDHVRRKEGL